MGLRFRSLSSPLASNVAGTGRLEPPEERRGGQVGVTGEGGIGHAVAAAIATAILSHVLLLL